MLRPPTDSAASQDERKVRMAEQAFKVGDVVQLKSGGPRMTVTQIGTSAMDDSVPFVWVAWFEGTKENTSSFVAAAVKLIHRAE